jgi:hypothetical protein
MIVLFGLEDTVPRPLGYAVDFLSGRTVSGVPLHPRAGLSAVRHRSVVVVVAYQERVEEDPGIRSAWSSQRIPRICLAEQKHVDLDMSLLRCASS